MFPGGHGVWGEARAHGNWDLQGGGAGTFLPCPSHSGNAGGGRRVEKDSVFLSLPDVTSAEVAICLYYSILGASQVARWKRTHGAVQESWVSSMGGEGPLKKEMATQSSILAWEIPWSEEPGGLQSMGLQKSQS